MRRLAGNGSGSGPVLEASLGRRVSLRGMPEFVPVP